jgi:hypothetical protein
MIRSLMCSALFAAAVSSSNAAAAQSVVAGEEHCVINVRSDDRLNMRAVPERPMRDSVSLSLITA